MRNALCDALISELRCALDDFEGNDAIGAIVLTGDERDFSAGADIKDMAELRSFAQAYLADFNGGN
jgi:enoyl-CoA hydratase